MFKIYDQCTINSEAYSKKIDFKEKFDDEFTYNNKNDINSNKNWIKIF